MARRTTLSAMTTPEVDPMVATSDALDEPEIPMAEEEIPPPQKLPRWAKNAVITSRGWVLERTNNRGKKWFELLRGVRARKQA